MIMTPGLRKFVLTAHVTSSVGWFGAVACFLVLAVAGLTSPDPQKVRAAYVAMELTASYVIVPLCLASLLTGIVQSLGTQWGLFRHYWVAAKLLITFISTVILLVHMQPINYLAGVAGEATLSAAAHGPLQIQLVVNAGAALAVLLVATLLSVYKPAGLTPYGRREQHEPRATAPDFSGTTGVGPGRRLTTGSPPWVKVSWLIVGVLLLVFVILHLTGNSPGRHGPKPPASTASVR